MKIKTECFSCDRKHWKKEVVLNKQAGLCGVMCRFCGWLDKIYQYGNPYDEERIKKLLEKLKKWNVRSVVKGWKYMWRRGCINVKNVDM